MNREDIVKLALESGFGCDTDGHLFTYNRDGICDEYLERFAALVAAAERERLIKAVESVPPHRWVDGSDQWGNPCPAKVVATKSDYVAAMRARGNT